MSENNCLLCGKEITLRYKYCSKSCSTKSLNSRMWTKDKREQHAAIMREVHKREDYIPGGRFTSEYIKSRREQLREARSRSAVVMNSKLSSAQRLKAANSLHRKRKEEPEFRERLMNITLAMLVNPKSNFGKSRSTAIYYRGVRMKSSWEVKFAQMCDERGIKWQYEPCKLECESGKVYIPDFKINSRLIEIKPRELQEAHKLKNITKEEVTYLTVSEFDSFFKGEL